MNAFKILTQNRKKVIFLVTIVFLVILSIAVVATALRKPGNEDFSYAKTAVSDVTKTQEALPAAANDYFAAFSREFNATGSADKAKQNASKEYEAFAKAESSAMEAIKQLVDSKAANNGDVDQAIKQYTDVSTNQTNYYAGMIASYSSFKGLFGGPDGVGCSGVFIGSTESLGERKDRLKKAAANCYPAIEKLKKSKNSAYVTYAFQMERRVKLLEQDAASIAKSEQQNNEFSKQLAVFEQKAADAKARNASEQEVLALANEIKAFNVKIKDNQADFDYSSKRYLATIKEFPTLAEAVFSDSISAKLKNLTSLSDVRLATLNLILDNQLLQ